MSRSKFKKLQEAESSHRIPMITVVKCGILEERGVKNVILKLILMIFFSRVTCNDHISVLDYNLH